MDSLLTAASKVIHFQVISTMAKKDSMKTSDNSETEAGDAQDDYWQKIISWLLSWLPWF